MKIRNTEGKHDFSISIDRAFHIYDMQGLLMDGQENFTAAVEAFEIGPKERVEKIMGHVFSSEELYRKSCFAAEVGVPFFLLHHRENTAEKENFIVMDEVVPDREHKSPERINRYKMTEKEFLAWWRERKKTVQTKQYRKDFQKRVKTSYFDWLLESNGEKWGGNIDGYFVSPDDDRILGIVEKRFTNGNSLKRYDPADYFKCGGGDYYTWKPLIQLRDQLAVPLFLFTFSNISGETSKVGMTVVDILKRNGIEYIKDRTGATIYPYSLLCGSLQEVKERLEFLYECALERLGRPEEEC